MSTFSSSFHPGSGPALGLSKNVVKLIGRIERIMVPVNTIVHNEYTLALSSRLDDFIKNRVRTGELYCISPFSGRLIVNWDAFDECIMKLLSENHPSGEAFVLPSSVVDELGAERYFQSQEEVKHGAKEKMRLLQERNGQPLMPGKWRKEPYPKRIYEELEDYCMTPFIDEEEENRIQNQLETSLSGFVGQAYNYDDHGLTEEWMVSFTDASNAPSDDEIIRVQCSTLLDILTVQVQDRVCNESKILQKEPIGLYSGKLKESQVWGIDCYTRKMIEIAIEDRLGKMKSTGSSQLDCTDVGIYTEKQIHTWLERILLPSINAQSEQDAHSMILVTQDILKKHNSSERKLCDIDFNFTQSLNEAAHAIGIDSFRIHPKGTGIICTALDGIAPHNFISEYLGEIYPPDRWCERLDVVVKLRKSIPLNQRYQIFITYCWKDHIKIHKDMAYFSLMQVRRVIWDLLVLIRVLRIPALT